MAMADNPFAAPLADPGIINDSTQHGEWRIEGDHLVCEDGTVLPPVSLRSGGREDLLSIKRKLVYVPWPVYLLLLLNVIIVAIVALLVQKKATLTYWLTTGEKRADRRKGALAFLLAAGGTITLIVGAVNNLLAAVFIGVMIIVGAIVIVVRGKLFTLVRIKDGFIRVKLRPAARDALLRLQSNDGLAAARDPGKRA